MGRRHDVPFSLITKNKSQDVFLRPSFPGHLLELSNACGFHPQHRRHSSAAVHVNLDVQKSSLAFYYNLISNVSRETFLHKIGGSY